MEHQQNVGVVVQDRLGNDEKLKEPKEISQRDQKGPLSQEPMWKTLFFFLIPLMLSNGLQSLGGTVGSMIIGRGLGENELAAASTVMAITFFLFSLMIGLGSASSVLIGQAYGAGNEEQMKKTVGTSLLFALALSVVMALVGIVFVRELLLLVGTPAAVFESAVEYARWVFVSLPVHAIFISYTIFLRGIGDSKTPLYYLLISTVLTIALSPVLAFGWLGLPALEIKGVALANMLGVGLTIVVIWVHLHRIRHILSLGLKDAKYIRFNPTIVALLVKVGLPTSVQMILISLSEVAVVSLVNGFGEQATAAYGAVIQVINYVHLPAMSLGMATGIFGAQLIGAKATDRLKELLTSAIGLNYVITACLVGLVYLFSGTIMSWFLVETATLELAKETLYMVLWSYLIFGHMAVFSGLMRSSGSVFWPTVITISAIWGVLVPVATWLSGPFGLKGVWMAYPVAFSVCLLAMYGYYRFFWKNKTHARLI